MSTQHVIDYDHIPADIKHIYQLTGAASISATTDGHWLIKLDPGINGIAIETALRSTGIPAFNGSPYRVTLRAITAGEIPLFTPNDQAILRQASVHAKSTDNKSVIDRILDNTKDAHLPNLT